MDCCTAVTMHETNEGHGVPQDKSNMQLLNEIKHLKDIINLKDTIMNELRKENDDLNTIQRSN